MSRFIIFQTNAEYYSAPWEIAKNNYSLNDYRAVYCEVIIDEIQYCKEITLINQDDLAILEDVAARFSKPQNRSGHTLSVSDVVAIERKNSTRFYYRDISGWKEIKKTKKNHRNRNQKRWRVLASDGTSGESRLYMGRDP